MCSEKELIEIAKQHLNIAGIGILLTTVSAASLLIYEEVQKIEFSLATIKRGLATDSIGDAAINDRMLSERVAIRRQALFDIATILDNVGVTTGY